MDREYSGFTSIRVWLYGMAMLGGLLFATNAMAFQGYIGNIPNGNTFTCNTCHGVAFSLNPFGANFAANNHAWDAALAGLDSDGDTYNNGAELQDPNGTWTSGTANPGNAALVSNPGDAASTPPAVATAVPTETPTQPVTAPTATPTTPSAATQTPTTPSGPTSTPAATSTPGGPTQTPRPTVLRSADLNGDGFVDDKDLLIYIHERLGITYDTPTPAPPTSTITNTPQFSPTPTLTGTPTLVPTETSTTTPSPTQTSTPPPSAAEILILSLSPRVIAELGLPYNPTGGLHVAGVGSSVILQATSPEILTGYAWRVAAAPAGATSVLSATNAETVEFISGRAGTYTIELAVRDGNSVLLSPVRRNIVAGNYVGVGTVGNNTPNIGRGQCMPCHAQIEQDWKKTRHATVFERHVNGAYPGELYKEECLECHTTGYDDAPFAVNGGFDDVARQVGFTVPDVLQPGNFEALPASLQNVSSVQCESCHGPGSQHFGNAQNTAADFTSGRCAPCHDSVSAHGEGFYTWDTSNHSELVGAFVAANPNCVRCHVAEGYVDAVEGRTPKAIANPTGITCAGCHDPHAVNNPNQLRVHGEVVYATSQIYAASQSATCFQCHRVNLGGRTPEAYTQTSARGAHHGPQGDVFLGEGAVEYGDTTFDRFSAHRHVIANGCVHCHMAPPPASEVRSDRRARVGEHSFAMRHDNGTPDDASDDILNAENTCTPCHQDLPNYNRAARGDYDGDGILEPVQKEVRGLLDILSAEIFRQAADVATLGEDGVIVLPTDVNLTTVEVRRAVYNYNLIVEDGSLGLHNTAYTVQVLQKTYSHFSGRPFADDFPHAVIR